MIEKHLHHLWKNKFCPLLNPKLVSANDEIGQSFANWFSFYRMEVVQTNSNYIVRKVNTNSTQSVHRIRSRPIKPKYKFENLDDLKWSNYRPDPITHTFCEPHHLTEHFMIYWTCLKTIKTSRSTSNLTLFSTFIVRERSNLENLRNQERHQWENPYWMFPSSNISISW